MNWTKKHDKFALACNLSESQGYVLRDALRKGKLHEPVEIELDLRKTNTWIGKVRPQGEYHRKTMTTAIAQLDEKTQGMITIIKRYNPWIYKVLIRPLSFVERIQSAKCAPIPKPGTGNPMFSEDHKIRARELLLQNISKLDSLFRKLGMHHTPDSLMRIWRLAGENMLEVKGAVEYMLTCHAEKLKRNPTSEGIATPEGWLHDCLSRGWHHKVESKLPYIEGENIHFFLDSLMGDVLRGKLPREKLPRVISPPV